MIRAKIKEEIKLQGLKQIDVVRAVNKLGKGKTLTQSSLSYYLSEKKLLSIYHIESIFEVLGISLIRIL